VKWPSGLFIWILIILKISELRSQVRELGSARGRKLEFPSRERWERDRGNIVSLSWQRASACYADPKTLSVALVPLRSFFDHRPCVLRPLQACYSVFQLPAPKKFTWSIFWRLFWCKFRWIEALYPCFLPQRLDSWCLPSILKRYDPASPSAQIVVLRKSIFCSWSVSVAPVIDLR
jgi:hypothetical protein